MSAHHLALFLIQSGTPSDLDSTSEDDSFIEGVGIEEELVLVSIAEPSLDLLVSSILTSEFEGVTAESSFDLLISSVLSREGVVIESSEGVVSSPSVLILPPFVVVEVLPKTSVQIFREG